MYCQGQIYNQIIKKTVLRPSECQWVRQDCQRPAVHKTHSWEYWVFFDPTTNLGGNKDICKLFWSVNRVFGCNYSQNGPGYPIRQLDEYGNDVRGRSSGKYGHGRHLCQNEPEFYLPESFQNYNMRKWDFPTLKFHNYSKCFYLNKEYRVCCPVVLLSGLYRKIY